MSAHNRPLSKRDLEAYALALYDVLLELEVMDGHCKSYDPLTFDKENPKLVHSYIFDLKDGGRHHIFETLETLRKELLEETTNNIRYNYRLDEPF